MHLEISPTHRSFALACRIRCFVQITHLDFSSSSLVLYVKMLMLFVCPKRIYRFHIKRVNLARVRVQSKYVHDKLISNNVTF